MQKLNALACVQYMWLLNETTNILMMKILFVITITWLFVQTAEKQHLSQQGDCKIRFFVSKDILVTVVEKNSKLIAD